MSIEEQGLEEVCLKIKRGDSWSRTMYFQDEHGVAINITGWTIRFTAKEKATDLDSAAKILKVITVLSNPTAGECEIALTPSDTALTIGNLLFDIQVTTNLAEVYTIVEGIINITQDISIAS